MENLTEPKPGGPKSGEAEKVLIQNLERPKSGVPEKGTVEIGGAKMPACSTRKNRQNEKAPMRLHLNRFIIIRPSLMRPPFIRPPIIRLLAIRLCLIRLPGKTLIRFSSDQDSWKC